MRALKDSVKRALYPGSRQDPPSLPSSSSSTGSCLDHAGFQTLHPHLRKTPLARSSPPIPSTATLSIPLEIQAMAAGDGGKYRGRSGLSGGVGGHLWLPSRTTEEESQGQGCGAVVWESGRWVGQVDDKAGRGSIHPSCRIGKSVPGQLTRMGNPDWLAVLIAFAPPPPFPREYVSSLITPVCVSACLQPAFMGPHPHKALLNTAFISPDDTKPMQAGSLGGEGIRSHSG